MENQYPPVIEKSLEVIKRFEEKFGWFSIRVYHFPQIDGFDTFLESVQRTLLRHRTIGWYMWAKISGTGKLLLISFGRGQWTGHFVEGVLILQNSSRKLKTVVDNAILLNYTVSSENIS